MKFRRINLANGPIIWQLEVPLEVELEDQYLRRLASHGHEFEEMLDEALGDVRDRIMGAIEEAFVHADDEFESDITEIDMQESDKELN